MSPEPRLERLPLEVMQDIIEHVAAADPPSILVLAATSKACHRATRKFVFGHISLKVDDAATLAEQVAALTEIIDRGKCRDAVRSISVEGYLVARRQDRPPALLYPSRGPFYRVSSHLEHIQRWYQRWGIPEILDDPEPRPYNAQRFEAPVTVPDYEDQGWAPLGRLIKGLPYLAKLVYNCGNQFPPSLLAIIHKHQPHCQLHLLSFRLRSLHLATPDRHEMELVTSPCLHTVHLEYSSRENSGVDDFNEHAMLDMVSGLAPNLKTAHAVFSAVPNRKSAMGRVGHPPKPEPAPVAWKGLPGLVPDSGTKGSLTSLALSGLDPIRAPSLENWAAVTDFSCLRHLDLGAGFGSQSGVMVDGFEWMAKKRPFPNLRTLRVRIMREIDIDEDAILEDLTDAGPIHALTNPLSHQDARLQARRRKPGLVETVIDFLNSLEPLVELSVSGHMQAEVLCTALRHHGRTLRKLELLPWDPIRNGYMEHSVAPMLVTQDLILQLQCLCPNLEELSLSIKRTRSDAREVALYRALGGFPHLRRLFITLNCSSRHDARSDVWILDPAMYSDDDEHSEDDPLEHLRNGDICNIFFNSAVDADLARSIWDVVHASMLAYGRDPGHRLDWLKLHTVGGDDLGRQMRYDD
ncbi:hypothetical protein MAPG_10428, partial [Magnaporthiopsis poae ATCC 64411]